MKKLLLIAALVLPLMGQMFRFPGPRNGSTGVAAGISFVQVTTGSNTAPATLTTTAGNLLYVSVSDLWGGTLLSISDGSNTYNLIGSQFLSSSTENANHAQFYAKNIPGGSITITVTSNATAGGVPHLTVMEFSGCSITAPLVGSSSSAYPGSGGANPSISPPFSAGAVSGQLIAAGIYNNADLAVFTAGPGYLIPSGANYMGNGPTSAEYQIATGTVTTASFSNSTHDLWNVIMAAVFRQ